MKNFYALNIRAIAKYSVSEHLAFYGILFYLVVEYMRPQTMYPALDFIPWGKFVIALTLLAAFVEGSMLRVSHKLNKQIFIFFLVVVASSSLALSPSIAFDNLFTIIALTVIYFMIANVLNTEKRYFVFVLLFILITLKLSQSVALSWVARGFEYDRYGAAVGSGWLANSGELVIQICIVFSLLIHMMLSLRDEISRTKYIALVACVFILGLAIIACGSRGGFLAFASILITMWLKSKKKTLGFILIAIAVVVFFSLLPERDFERTIAIGGAEDNTGQSRLERWRKGWVLTVENPFLGVGYENWAVADRQRFGGTGEEVHNIYLESSSELGFAGLLVFMALAYSCYRTNQDTTQLAKKMGNKYIAGMAQGQNCAMIAFLVAGTFVTVLYYPYFWINLGMTTALNTIAKNNMEKIKREENSNSAG